VGTPTTLVLAGTTGNDVFEFVAGTTADDWVVKLNASLCRGGNVVAITFDGLAGTDTMKLIGTTWPRRRGQAGRGQLTGSGFSVNASNVENFTLDAGGGRRRAADHDSSSAIR